MGGESPESGGCGQKKASGLGKGKEEVSKMSIMNPLGGLEAAVRFQGVEKEFGGEMAAKGYIGILRG